MRNSDFDMTIGPRLCVHCMDNAVFYLKDTEIYVCLTCMIEENYWKNDYITIWEKERGNKIWNRRKSKDK